MFSTKTIMQLEVEKRTNLAIININELELDSNNSPILKDTIYQLEKEGYSNLIIDMAKTNYCNSAGLSALLIANRICKKKAGLFVLSGINESVGRLIKISQLDSILKICDSVDQAKQLIAQYSGLHQ